MIRLAIFDMDGTIFESYLDWQKIKKSLNIKSGNILKEIFTEKGIDHIRLSKLERYENINTIKTKPVAGIADYLLYLDKQNIKTALITNNNISNTNYLLKKFNLNFNLIVTREMNLWKPDPDAFIFALSHFKTKSIEAVSIGDSIYDVKASMAAHINDIYIIDGTGSKFPEMNNIKYFNDYVHLKNIFQSM